jgi:putative transposase
MARPLRLQFSGAVYHLTSRGNRQGHIYHSDEDRKIFLDILGKIVKRYNWVCHGYCLMDNHYHLLIETVDANLSLGMRQLNGMYTQYNNRRHGKVGHVFQGRYKSILVEKDHHLLELCRYIVLNPVKAKMTVHPGKWQWSSYHFTSTGKGVPEFLSVDWILLQFCKQKTKARKRYVEFVTGSDEVSSPWEKLVGQAIYGSERFVEELQLYLGQDQQSKEIPKLQRFAGRPTLAELIPEAIYRNKPQRNDAIVKAHLEHGYTLKEIADEIGIHYTTVSKVLSRYDEM